MPANYLSKLTLPVKDGNGDISNIEYIIKDAEAREMIEDLGHALYWVGVTESVLTDGGTTNPVVIATYAAAEPVGTENPVTEGWYEVDESGTSDTGYVLSEDTTVDPEKTYYIRTATNKTVNLGGVASYGIKKEEYVWNGTAWQEFGAKYKTAAISPVTDAGEAPEAYFEVSNENATFVFDAGSVPTLGNEITVLTM